MPKGVWADNSGSIHFCRAVVPVANTFAQNNPQNNSESNIKINPRDYSHHTAMIGGYFANFQTNTRASPLKISVISHQIRETILIQPAKLPPFLKLPVMPELIRMPGSSALKRLGQVSNEDHKRFESSTSPMIGDVPVTIQEEPCRTCFTFHGLRTSSVPYSLSPSSTQDVIESDWN